MLNDNPFAKLETIKIKLPVNYNEINQNTRRQVREEYIDRQEGLCSYCGYPLGECPPNHIMEKEIDYSLFPKTMFDHPIHLHHCHETGMTIGAVHNTCNAVMWQYDGQ